MKMKPAEVIVSREHLVIRKKRDGRCVYSREGKRALVEACRRPGVSVAGIALLHGVNANVLRKWITHHHQWQDKADSVRQWHRLNPKEVFHSGVKFCFEVQVMSGSFWPCVRTRVRRVTSRYCGNCGHSPQHI
jgi:hypothetical protein